MQSPRKETLKSDMGQAATSTVIWGQAASTSLRLRLTGEVVVQARLHQHSALQNRRDPSRPFVAFDVPTGKRTILPDVIACVLSRQQFRRVQAMGDLHGEGPVLPADLLEDEMTRHPIVTAQCISPPVC